MANVVNGPDDSDWFFIAVFIPATKRDRKKSCFGVSCGCLLGCSRKSLFSSFGWRFFFLCTNVVKSCQKKFGVD